jgi:hypothetical protein
VGGQGGWWVGRVVGGWAGWLVGGQGGWWVGRVVGGWAGWRVVERRDTGRRLGTAAAARRPAPQPPAPQPPPSHHPARAAHHVALDRLPDGALARALADLGDVCAAEAVRELDQQVEVDVGRDGRLAQVGLEDLRRGCGVCVVVCGWWCGGEGGVVWWEEHPRPAATPRARATGAGWGCARGARYSAPAPVLQDPSLAPQAHPQPAPAHLLLPARPCAWGASWAAAVLAVAPLVRQPSQRPRHSPSDPTAACQPGRVPKQRAGAGWGRACSASCAAAPVAAPPPHCLVQ